MAQSGHPDALNQCPLWGVKRTSAKGLTRLHPSHSLPLPFSQIDPLRYVVRNREPAMKRRSRAGDKRVKSRRKSATVKHRTVLPLPVRRRPSPGLPASGTRRCCGKLRTPRYYVLFQVARRSGIGISNNLRGRHTYLRSQVWRADALRRQRVPLCGVQWSLT